MIGRSCGCATGPLWPIPYRVKSRVARWSPLVVSTAWQVGQILEEFQLVLGVVGASFRARQIVC